jgi:hypothetical protein
VRLAEVAASPRGFEIAEEAESAEIILLFFSASLRLGGDPPTASEEAESAEIILLFFSASRR